MLEKDLLLSINRPQKLCMNCNAPIDVIERHPSVLKLAAKKKLERWDYCPECWQQMKDESWESFWITKRAIKEVRARKLNRRERSAALRALFESIWDRRETEEVGLHLYFLAHLLLKWGGLRWRENRLDEAGREVVVFEDPTTGDALEVSVVEADEEHIAAVNEEIERFLRQYASEDKEEE